MGQPKLDTCMWDLIDSNIELFMFLVKGDRFGTCRPNVSFFFFQIQCILLQNNSDMQFC